MDTSGHHTISNVGVEILEDALARAGRKGLRTNAFYLGNWLTDVSQTVDIRTYTRAMNAANQLLDAIARMFDRMLADAPTWFIEPLETITGRNLLRSVRSGVRKAQADLSSAINALLDNGGEVAEGFGWAFRYIGYFKFVLAKDGSSNDRMDEDAYFKIIDDRFRAYYPHEHLDRPETAPGRFADAKASGPYSPRAAGSASATAGDLYAYLRDDIRIAAGLLAYLDAGGEGAKAGDFGWAAATFHPQRKEFCDADGKRHPVSDKDYEWNRHLSLLGHALHAVEDYFAHSTFVEHATFALPLLQHKRFQQIEDYGILARRLKEWRPGFVDRRDDWQKLKDDTHVVTGYFDLWDTVISLRHAYDELRGNPRETIGKSLDDAVDYDYAKLLADTLALAEDPSIVKAPENQPTDPRYEEKANVAVKWLRKQGGHGLNLALGQEAALNQLVEFMVQRGPLRDKPAPVKQAFVNGARRLGKVVGYGLAAHSIYSILKKLVEFVADPLAWLGEFLPDEAAKLLHDYGKVYVENLVLDALGAQRIGCHSLIAKDTGPEVLHEDSMRCAKAVHRFVLYAVTRHARPATLALARSDDHAAPGNVVALGRCIDWLELLEYFLAHPFANVDLKLSERTVAITKVHVTRPGPRPDMSEDSLASLAKEYRKSFHPGPGAPPRFTWETIADANFPTVNMTPEHRKRQINKLLKETGTGTVVKDGINYAFKPGLRIRIPFQKATIPDASSSDVRHRWWYAVILEDAGEKWLKDGMLTQAAPRAHRPWLQASRKDHDDLVAKATQDRTKGEQDYGQRRMAKAP